MKKIYALPFAVTALVTALSGCGGESAKVIPETYDSSTVNGACKSASENCVEFILDYPVDGINFTCSSDSKNKFVTLFDASEGVSSGACRVGDTVNFYLQGEKDKRIELGSVQLDNLSKVASASTPPRLTLIDLASGMTKQQAQSISPNDATVKVAMRLAMMIQALGMKNNQVSSATEIQPVYIGDSNRQAIESLEASVTTATLVGFKDDEFSAWLNQWLGQTPISTTEAFSLIEKLMNISTAAVYQPEFALFSTEQSLISALSGSNGLVGCDKDTCSPSDKTKTNIFGHFLLMTDRQGVTFGSGLQWRGKVDESLNTIGGTNALLMTKVKPKQMTASPQETWIDPLTKEIDQARQFGFKFDVDETGAQPLVITQGKLLANKMVVGTGGNLYQTLTNKKESEITSADAANYGLWNQTVNGTLYKGTLDLYKLYPLSYLDKNVFSTQANTPKSTYVFPLYADLTFKFNDTTVKTVKLGIVIDRNGDIRTNIKPNVPANIFDTAIGTVDLSTDDATGCRGQDVLNKYTMIDDQNTQQYRIGTVTRTFTKGSKVTPETISLRMILADKAFGTLNGALIGMNTTIQTSTDSSTSIVVGGALLQMANLLSASAGIKPSGVVMTDSANQKVRWANSFASFNGTYSNSVPTDTESKEIAKLAGGEITLDLAPCYTVKAK